MRSLGGLSAVVAIGVMGVAPGVAWPAGHWSDLFRPAKPPHPAVVRVIAPNGNSFSLGSGALVAVRGQHGLVVTNWHVVRDATGVIQVAFPDGFRSPALVLKTDAEWDLAALAIWRPRVEPIPLATQAPRPGEPLTIAGYGSGGYREVTGQCTQYVAPGVNQPFEMVELSARARQGDSGGPILNARGELAGVLFGASFRETTGSYCGRVRQFLASVADDFQRLQPADALLVRGPTTGQRAGELAGAGGHPPAGRPSAGLPGRGELAGGPPGTGGPGGGRLGAGRLGGGPQGAISTAFPGPPSTQGWRPIAGSSGAVAVGPRPSAPPVPAGPAHRKTAGAAASGLAQAQPGPVPVGGAWRAPEAAIAGGPEAGNLAVPAQPPSLETSGSDSQTDVAPPPTLFEQVRNVLAAIGAFALFLHGLRLILANRPD